MAAPLASGRPRGCAARAPALACPLGAALGPRLRRFVSSYARLCTRAKKPEKQGFFVILGFHAQALFW